MGDDELLDALAQDDPETRAAIERIMDACPGPAYQGIVLAKIANRFDPDKIHRITTVEDDVVELLTEETGPKDEALARILAGVR